jgi:NDP-sugar pyrophosphorylase family protein
VKKGARVGPHSAIGRHCHIGEEADVEDVILWPNTWVDTGTRLRGTVAGRNCHFGRNVEITGAAMFGDKSVVTDYSRA